jgi:DNA polymerase/3'-5' exonuclease PolX
VSATTKLPFAQVRSVAAAVVERLSPACHRVEVAGSLRRCAEMVGDIEIVAVPVLDVDLFGNPTSVSEVDRLLAGWPIQLLKNGPKYKQFSFVSTAGNTYTVDLFLQPDPATWGVNFLIRTGSADFSHRMVTPKWQGGYMPNEFRVEEARVWRGGGKMLTPEEQDVFELWEMDFIPPEKR